MTITQEALNKVEELISTGWEFFLRFGDNADFCDIKENSWEADFTRRLPNGLWDNHEQGFSLDPSEAISIAYDNIKKGKKLNK